MGYLHTGYVSQVSNGFQWTKENDKKQEIDSVSEKLHFSLDCVTSKGYSFLIHVSIHITMFVKNRKVYSRGEWLNELQPDSMMAAA